jgi:hypothetical protein
MCACSFDCTRYVCVVQSEILFCDVQLLRSSFVVELVNRNFVNDFVCTFFLRHGAF